MKKGWFWVLAVALGGPVSGAWYGDLGTANLRDGHSMEFMYDTGKRDLEPENGGNERELTAHRFVLQYARGLGQGFEWLFRGTPSTGRMNMEGSSLNPDLWGVGGGIHWAPPESLGPVRVGLLATVDYSDARSSSANSLSWLELAFTVGITVPLPRGLKAMGGVTFARGDVRFKENGTSTDYTYANEGGGYVGAGWSPNEAWTLATELHAGVEQAWALSVRYHFQ